MASTSIKSGKTVSGRKGTKPAKAVSTKDKPVGSKKNPRARVIKRVKGNLRILD